MATTAIRRRSTFRPFFRRLANSRRSALLLDYDGTLAPFQKERETALPYEGVTSLLEKILVAGDTRIVVVSGRSARDVPPLLGLPVEVWGSHGMERLLPNGEFRANTLDSRVARAFSTAEEQLEQAELRDYMEMKNGSLAVHWRGVAAERAREIYTKALRVMQPAAFSAGLAIVNFDGGIEMRVKIPNKADVVRTILKEEEDGIPIAYLGDDVTDEDAFTALNSSGLTVLVRPESRATAAQFWIRPPDELLGFLQNWLSASGGDYDTE